jgi:hypothetical protein
MSDPARVNLVPKMMLSVTTIANFDIAPSRRSGGFLSSQQSTRAAYPRWRSSNANSLQSQNSAGFRQICAIFQSDNLCRHF